jgi:hypothetical protein
MQYIIKAESGISGICNLGEGLSEKAAWEDAFGPKPWTDYQKRSAKKCWCEKVRRNSFTINDLRGTVSKDFLRRNRAINMFE